MNKFLNSTLRTAICAFMMVSISPVVLAQDAEFPASNTPIFDLLDETDGKGLKDDRNKACLLGAKIVEQGSLDGFIDVDDAKVDRAIDVQPKFEMLLKDSEQTDLLFNKVVAEIKSEYQVYKTSDKKEQKSLFKIAKSSNKGCTKSISKIDIKKLQRTDIISGYLSNFTARKAEQCHAANVAEIKSSSTDLRSLLSLALDSSVWNSVYIDAKHREGMPSGEKVERLTIKEASIDLSDLGVDQALRIRDECSKKLKDARFRYELESEKLDDYKSTIVWDN